MQTRPTDGTPAAPAAAPTHQVKTSPKDSVTNALQRVSQNIYIAVFGLLPIFFLPVAYAPFEYTKILLVIVGVMMSVIFFSLSVLRSGTITLSAPLSLWVMWSIPAVALISALLSGDMNDAILGDTFGTQTALFLALMAFVTTSVTLVMHQKTAIMRFYMVLMGSAIVLGLFHVIRILFGADILTLGVFNNAASTPLGSWNDLGLFFGLAVILSLVTLEQLPLTKNGKIAVGVIVGLSLIVLSAVNFFAVWLVLGFVSLIMLIYSLSKDRFASANLSFAPAEKNSSAASIIASVAVFMVSFLFVIGGTVVGGKVSEWTGVSYIEVRPSISATADIAKSVYSENAFTGIGPNKFVDAWRLYKDPSINQTIFWATDFNAGSGYVTTLFVTMGVLGVLSILAFFVTYLRNGARMLFASQGGDKLLFFIATSSFIASVYLWGLSVVYVPSATILLLTAVFTGITFSVYGALLKSATKNVVFGTDRRTGFLLVASIMLLIVGSVTTMYMSGRHYAASYVFAEGLSNIQPGTTLEQVEQSISNAYSLSRSDVFARQVASYQIARMNTLLSVAEPTTEQQGQFQAAIANGINAARLAVDTDGSDALNWATLGAVYSIVSAAGIEGAYDLSKEAFTQARVLDPNNPTYVFAEAQLESRNGNLDAARTLAQDAIRLRQRFPEAVYFLSQLEVAAGNLEEAINTTIASVRLEPNNPARYYQLGILYSSNQQIDNAILAFEEAVRLDQNFANARYFLALAYLETDRQADAVAQLEKVAELNPDNEQLKDLVEGVRSGEVQPNIPTTPQVTEPDPVTTDGEQVTTETVPDSSLVSPVNPGVGGTETTETVETPEFEEVPTDATATTETPTEG